MDEKVSFKKISRKEIRIIKHLRVNVNDMHHRCELINGGWSTLLS
jgi:hypothetical protein